MHRSLYRSLLWNKVKCAGIIVKLGRLWVTSLGLLIVQQLHGLWPRRGAMQPAEADILPFSPYSLSLRELLKLESIRPHQETSLSESPDFAFHIDIQFTC